MTFILRDSSRVQRSYSPDPKGVRFPSEVISHAVWLQFRFSLRYRDVEHLVAQREIVVTSETVWQWRLTCGQSDAKELPRHRPRCGDTWHLDEVFLTDLYSRCCQRKAKPTDHPCAARRWRPMPCSLPGQREWESEADRH